MVKTMTIDGEERFAVIFPSNDEKDCIESMKDGLLTVLQVVVEEETVKNYISPACLGQLVKMVKILSFEKDY